MSKVEIRCSCPRCSATAEVMLEVGGVLDYGWMTCSLCEKRFKLVAERELVEPGR